jgi:hypothetical protein
MGKVSACNCHLRKRVDDSLNTLTMGAANWRTIAQANALLFVPSGVKSLPAGTIMEAILIQELIIIKIEPLPLHVIFWI